MFYHSVIKISRRRVVTAAERGRRRDFWTLNQIAMLRAHSSSQFPALTFTDHRYLEQNQNYIGLQKIKYKVVIILDAEDVNMGSSSRARIWLN